MPNKAVFMFAFNEWFELKDSKEKLHTTKTKLVKLLKNYKKADSTITHYEFGQKFVTEKFILLRKPPTKRPLDLTTKSQMDMRVAVKKEKRKKKRKF